MLDCCLRKGANQCLAYLLYEYRNGKFRLTEDEKERLLHEYELPTKTSDLLKMKKND